MLTVFSPEHAQHHATAELIDGAMTPPVETPRRAEEVLGAVEAVGLGAVVAPDVDGPDVRAAILAVHAERFVDFLAVAHQEWLAAGHTGDALPLVWPAGGLGRGREPDAIDGRLGHWSFDAGTPITGGTWTAANASARCALTAARRVLGGEAAVFALCRPPGHHATADQLGGYCFLNNAAVAAQALRDGGAAKVAVLDVDYHHGNGTQSIFWERADVLTISIHADPRQEFPYFTGYADEVGPGGTNVNLPLRWGTELPAWRAELDVALAAVRSFGADALVVPLGVDTYVGDPICQFRLETVDYPVIGAVIGAVGLPTVVTMEGGYAVDAIGANVAGFLSGLAE